MSGQVKDQIVAKPQILQPRQLTFIHTVRALEPVFASLAAERLPNWHIASILDESLLSSVIATGHVNQEVSDRLASHVSAAKASGSSAIIVTCSTLGEAVDALAAKSATPLYRIDRGMAERAVLQASTIGILATLPTTLEPTTRLLESTAKRMGRPCKFVSQLVNEAFAQLKSGNQETHDRLVREAYAALSAKVDLVVLAQASMARALQAGQHDRPYLTSPELGMDQIASLLRLSRMSAD
ncbi:aspartate/glutamate racemase family protein [Agrobacterium albertimagni]|uniref:aspartate/glutamate racemase family protein n=1 Tax=Agrobacterium albertimagni TaxID=147266 RepID=UPI001F0B34C2|nr:aspartate/glutamate racemase family protein [Agrobacterium albertimagni]